MRRVRIAGRGRELAPMVAAEKAPASQRTEAGAND